MLLLIASDLELWLFDLGVEGIISLGDHIDEVIDGDVSLKVFIHALVELFEYDSIKESILGLLWICGPVPDCRENEAA